MITDIARQRLANQQLLRPQARTPDAVVAWFGAVQAQEYAQAKWSTALRMAEATTDAAIERRFDAGRFLRTHVLRPTWHFVTPADIHWMLELTAPRVQRALAYAYRYYGVDPELRARGTRVIARALKKGDHLTRAELGAHLARASIALKGVPLWLLTGHAELEGVICSGAQRGKDATYALLDIRAPKRKRLSRDEALGELTRRYFRSHGPATIRDFAWWSGLTTTHARRGLEIISARPEAVDGLTYWTVDPTRAAEQRVATAHLLPTYDEYFVAYRDLRAIPRGTAPRGGLQQALLAGGQFAGTWKAVRGEGGVLVDVSSSRTLTSLERQALARTAARYGRFLGAGVELRLRRR